MKRELKKTEGKTSLLNKWYQEYWGTVGEGQWEWGGDLKGSDQASHPEIYPERAKLI